MGDLEGFDARKHQKMDEYVLLPEGYYPAIGKSVEWKDTKDKTGAFLAFTWKVVDGEHKGVQLISRLNLKNKNDTAVKIAQSELTSICHAVGKLTPSDSSELCNVPIMIKVGVEERNDKPGTFQNRVIGYEPMGSDTASKPVSQPISPAQQQGQAPAHQELPPWKR